MLVRQTFAGWNRGVGWLRQLEAIRAAARRWVTAQLRSRKLEAEGGEPNTVHRDGGRGNDALESIGRHLSGARNRKNLIWVSAGFPLGAFGYRGRSRAREITRATRALNDANVALYTVDARGLIPTLTGVPGSQTFTTLSMVALNRTSSRAWPRRRAVGLS